MMVNAAATDSASIAAALLFSNGRAFGFLNVSRSPSVRPAKSTTRPPPTPVRTRPSRRPGPPPRGGRGPPGPPPPPAAPSPPQKLLPTFPPPETTKGHPRQLGVVPFPSVLLGIFYQFKGCFSSISRSCHCFTSACFTTASEQTLAQAAQKPPGLFLLALQSGVGHFEAFPKQRVFRPQPLHLGT